MRRLIALAVSAASAAALGCSPEGGNSSRNGATPTNTAAAGHERRPSPPQPGSGADPESAWLVGRWGLDGDCDPDGMSMQLRLGGQFDAPGTFGPVRWQLRDEERLHLVSREPHGGEARPPEGHARDLLETSVWQVRHIPPDRLSLSNGDREDLYQRCPSSDEQ